jgi:hypothetical protein
MRIDAAVLVAAHEVVSASDRLEPNRYEIVLTPEGSIGRLLLANEEAVRQSERGIRAV